MTKDVRKFTVFVLGACAGLTLASTAGTQITPASHAKIELIADDASPSGSTVWVGLLFRMDPGWHIYWRNPGDSGTPPKVEWQLPPWYRAGAIRWPVPVRLSHGSIADYAYEDEVLLMAPIDRASNSRDIMGVTIAADVKYVVCSDVCIPGKEHLALTLPQRGPEADDPASDQAEWHTIFQRTRSQIPRPAPATWELSAESREQGFILSVRTGGRVKTASFFPLDPNEIENSAPQSFAATRERFWLTLRKSDQLVTRVVKLRGLLVFGPQTAFEVAVPVVGK